MKHYSLIVDVCGEAKQVDFKCRTELTMFTTQSKGASSFLRFELVTGETVLISETRVIQLTENVLV